MSDHKANNDGCEDVPELIEEQYADDLAVICALEITDHHHGGGGCLLKMAGLAMILTLIFIVR